MISVVFAICCCAVVANGNEACAPRAGAPVASGQALLQGRSSLLQSGSGLDLKEGIAQESGDMLRSVRYGTAGYLGAPNCLPSETVSLRQTRRGKIGLLAMQLNQKQVGGEAALDATGFKEVTSLCCPAAMEQFFNRLLESRGYDVCSKPHVQGLMHWFTCVPDMDFHM